MGGQVALALVLVVFSGLMLRSCRRLLRSDGHTVAATPVHRTRGRGAWRTGRGREHRAGRGGAAFGSLDIVVNCAGFGAIARGSGGTRIVGIAPGLVEAPSTRKELEDPAGASRTDGQGNRLHRQ
jgi:NAD(P)-dependent dehydrogenase (short-subunit alcohol dehydrogenase family)